MSSSYPPPNRDEPGIDADAREAAVNPAGVTLQLTNDVTVTLMAT
ncbi:MAG TPA: hypothetical protein VJV78_07915 [Polyangiales bacterium]|nr:hypothetical protein [Polyangiales bacterium]